MFGVNAPELIVVLIIVLIIFGPKKLPGLGRAVGSTIKEFRESVKGLGDVMNEEPKEQPKTTLPPSTTVAQNESKDAPEAPKA